jgi:hypothetical protein
VICLGELRPTSIVGLSNLDVLDTISASSITAQNLYTRSQVDELLGTWTYRLPDGSLDIEKTLGLAAALASKVSTAELQNGLLSLNLANVVAGEVRTASLDVSGTTLANQIMASTITATNVVSGIGSFGKFSSDLIFDNGSTLHLAYRDEPFAVRIGNTSARLGINCEVTQSSGLALDCVGGARFSGGLTAGSTITVNAGSSDVSAIFGNDDSFLRVKNGRQIDSYLRNGAGSDLYLCQHTNNTVRVSTKLFIGSTLEGGAYQLSVQGAGIVSDFMMCPAYRIGSDERLKENVEDVSLDECTRLLLAVRPKTYSLKATGEEQCGYIAQHWKLEAQTAYRNSIVGESLGEEQMLALDYSRVVPILHGSLLDLMSKLDAALARIEALESRL